MNMPADIESLELVLEKQKTIFLDEGIPSADERKRRLQLCIDLLVDNQKQLAEALNEDYGSRHEYLTLMSEVMQGIAHIKYCIKKVAKWMKDEKRAAPFPMGLLGSSAVVTYQPKGVIGIMAPWNFPIAMVINPLCYAFAAGNRALIKPSEFTPKTSELLQKLFKQYFPDGEAIIVTGGPEVGATFSSLPLDHILFTGATGIGKKVMQAAAQNLTPVTLELGGKSPVIIGESADINEATGRMISGKLMNSGQVCISPDYVFVPENKLNAFLEQAKKTFAEQFPTQSGNNEYNSIINERNYNRIVSYIEDAKTKGVRVEPLSGESSNPQERKVPLTLVINPTDDSNICCEEIFGPLLIVHSYSDVKGCVARINQGEKPLALYYFGKDKAEEHYVLNNTFSGGATVNNVMMHVSSPDAPFGGVGASGMGTYQGVEGFKTFSHARTVFRQGKVDLSKLAGTIPPYTDKLGKMLAGQIKK